MTGTVFDIQRFGLHDGPGIRTVVFLKGCPLKCDWCCNPESQKKPPQLGFIKKNCTNCMACVDVCPTNSHQNINGEHQLNFANCNNCGKCIDECAHNALKMYGKEMSVEQVMDIVLKDKTYYDESGGGMTISGGEPTVQFDFMISLLKAAKGQNIHTCLETCGYTSTENLDKALEYTDLFLYDHKLTEPALHKKYTGVSNKTILKNLDFLYQKQAKIILRCPVIPGINDTQDHFEGIANINICYPNLAGIEIMPFHNFGRSKAESINREWKMNGNTVPEPQVAGWLKTLNELGCKNIKRG